MDALYAAGATLVGIALLFVIGWNVAKATTRRRALKEVSRRLNTYHYLHNLSQPHRKRFKEAIEAHAKGEITTKELNEARTKYNAARVRADIAWDKYREAIYNVRG